MGAGRREGRGGPVEALKPADTPPDIQSFDEWDLVPEVQDSIADMNITLPTPIQALTIGPVLEGRDVIAKAETGTGKTLAFGAPMMSKIDPARKSVLGLVLSPTRELAEQVYKVLATLGEARGLRVALIVGGEPLNPQVKALQSGAQVVVGTPGRVLDLMQQGFLSFPWTEFAVLDEADKMLEIGFIDDVRKILAACNEERQTLLFSATFPTTLLKLARESTRDPLEVATASGIATVDTIAQYWLEVTEDGRARSLARIIEKSGPDDVFLVFCDRRTDVDRLLRRMERERFGVKALHGGYDQAARFRVMNAYREGDVKCLIATDVASRGLDVEHVTFVVNFGVPRDVSDYTHRIGRTGRAGREGTAITLVGPTNRRAWESLVRSAPYEIKELPPPQELFGGGRGRSARDKDEPPRRKARDDSDGSERTRRSPEADGRQDTVRPTPGRGNGSGASGAGARASEQGDPPARAPRESGRTSGGFGAGVDETPPRPASRPGGRRARKPRPAPEPPDEEVTDNVSEDAPTDGFGAGI